LTTLRFAEDLAEPSFIANLSPARSDAREVKLALQLIEGLSREWDPARYKDDYTANLLRVIEAKSKGAEPKLKTKERPVSANVVSLMERLKESLAAQKGSSKTAAKKPASRTATSSRPHAKKRKRAA